MTKAHQQEVTVRFIERWPDHEPREQDPHYALFNAAKRRLKRQGLLKCQVVSGYHYGGIELHHSKVEYAHINDVDLQKFNDAYGLALTDELFQEYVEQEGNLEPLCVTGKSRVLMADGRQRRIDSIRPGDEVICHLGHVHAVSAVMEREVDEVVYLVGRARLTAEHPVSTSSGFVPAGELAVGQVIQQLGMLVPQMLRVRAVKHKVLGSVVELVSVLVVDPLLRLKATAKHLLHHVAVLKQDALLVAVPDMQPGVAFGGDLTFSDRFAGARQAVQASQAAVVGAEPLAAADLPALHLEAVATPSAHDGHALHPADGRAVARASGVGVREVGGNEKRSPARNAGFLHALASFAAWRPINRLRVARHRGAVYNLDVTGCHTYVVGGVAVHNCVLHHRGQEGVHSLPEPEWNTLRVSKDPHSMIVAESNNLIGVVGPK